MTDRAAVLSMIRASAGAGKTHRIMEEYLRWVLDTHPPVPFHAILALTFTNKAAYEMKDRILNQLKAHPLYRRILANYELFAVSTLDAFYQRMIEAFLHELGLSSYQRLEIDWTLRLPELTQRFFRLVQQNAALRKLVSDFLQQQLDAGDNWNVERLMYRSLQENIQFIYDAGFVETHLSPADLKQLLHGLTALKKRNRELGEAAAAIAEEILQMLDAAGISENDIIPRRKEWQVIQNARQQQLFQHSTKQPEKDLLTSKTTWSPAAFVKKKAQDRLPHRVEEQMDSLRQTVAALALLRQIQRHFMHGAMMAAAAAVMRQFKSDERLLFLADAPFILSRLLVQDQLPFVYEKMGIRYGRLIIDEFQDTSRRQWDILQPMVEEALASGGEVVLVGDQKQSIYGWRGADSRLMDEIIQQARQQGRRLETPVLRHNWRSAPDIITFNNQFFTWAARQLQDHHTTVPDVYADVQQEVGKFKDARGYVSVDFLNREDGKRHTDPGTIMDWMVGRIRNAFKEGIEAGAVMVLVRDNKEAQQVLRRLLQEDIPAVTPSSFKLLNLPPIQLLRAVLRLGAYPEDAAHHRMEAAALWHRLVPEISIEEALQRIDEAHQTVSETPATHPLEHLRAWTYYLRWHAEAAIAPYVSYLEEVMQDLLKDADGSLETLLERLDRRGEAIDLPLAAQPDAVRILTIHKAKGLDAEVVIVPNATWDLHLKGGPNSQMIWLPFKELAPALGLSPELLPDFQAALPYAKGLENILPAHLRPKVQRQKDAYLIEQFNLLYVAFTRARFVLHIAVPHRNPAGKSTDKITTVGDLLALYCEQQSREWGDYSPAIRVAVDFRGDAEARPVHSRPIRPLPDRRPDYPGIRTSELFTSSLPEWLQFQQGRKKGISRHRLIQKIRTLDDVPEAETELRAMLAQPEIAPYYQPDNLRMWDAANEYPLMDREGRLHILDRILWHKTRNEAVIIDYKFTDQPRTAYIKQIQTYMQLVHQQTGRTVKGFIVFPRGVEVLPSIP